MEKTNATIQLANAIKILETRQKKQLQAVNDQFETLVNCTKPINILNNTIEDLKKFPDVNANILTSVASIASGYLTRKLLVGDQSGMIKKIGGYALQYMITNLVSKK